ncbi:MAG: MlaE family ABC transporter permease [Gemmatimonadales bacterium]
MLTPLAAIGGGVTRAIAQLGAMARFSAGSIVSWRWLPRAGRRVVFRVLSAQVWFTALQAIPVVVVLASILSFLLISQAVRELGRLGATELIGRLVVVAIVRELGPLVTALIVTGRSGTAIAAELATNKVMGEVRSLESMGIDPAHYLVIPRFGGAIISVFGLIIVFDVVAVMAGWVAATVNNMTSATYFAIVLNNLDFQDVWLTLAKGLVFGVIVGIVPSFHGLSVGRAATDVPVAASRAVVTSIIAIFIASGLFVAVSLS